MTSWPSWTWGTRGVAATTPGSGSGQDQNSFTLDVGLQRWFFERVGNAPNYNVYIDGGLAGSVSVEALHNKQAVSEAIDGRRTRLPVFLTRDVLLQMFQRLNQQQRPAE